MVGAKKPQYKILVLFLRHLNTYMLFQIDRSQLAGLIVVLNKGPWFEPLRIERGKCHPERHPLAQKLGIRNSWGRGTEPIPQGMPRP